ncbi:MAG: GNAT family N-acetyltransferase [Bacteroidales bacterium]|nr:GNAT family N-acetyltransferase [Bacteroidales bacterium]MBN2819508.1 GNAT family N-acetyltransferase [Bacteroidales bacterium]
MTQLKIKCANPKDASILTQIAFAAKKIWNYPQEYYEIWKDELAITEKYIADNTVFKAILQNKVVGFYSIVLNPADFYSGEVYVMKGNWLEHIFILPEYHKKGIGSMLTDHAKEQCRQKKLDKLFIFVDPFAKGFYDKIGAEFLYNSKSSIPGREIPVYSLPCNYSSACFLKP